jgi:hypothetical protein
MPINKDVKAYNVAQRDAQTCEALAKAIDRQLPDAESKIWHRHPVWFLDGNPIVGYSTLKDCTRLLFWSGQTFDEPGLAPEGTFKAAEARYTNADQISAKDLKAVAGEVDPDPVGLQEHSEAQGQARAAEVIRLAPRKIPGRIARGRCGHAELCPPFYIPQP